MDKTKITRIALPAWHNPTHPQTSSTPREAFQIVLLSYIFCVYYYHGFTALSFVVFCFHRSYVQFSGTLLLFHLLIYISEPHFINILTVPIFIYFLSNFFGNNFVAEKSLSFEEKLSPSHHRIRFCRVGFFVCQ